MCEIFDKHISTLQKTSIDTCNGKDMTNSQYPVVDFDEVKDEYIDKNSLKLKDIPSSVDAILKKGNDIFFIEFKNGRLDAKDVYDIRKKIYDTLLIYGDITGNTINYTREFVEFILVCNAERNSKENLAETFQKNKMSESSLFSPLFPFEKYCFKKISVYTKAGFKQNFTNNL